jgi:hypothetical protein
MGKMYLSRVKNVTYHAKKNLTLSPYIASLTTKAEASGDKETLDLYQSITQLCHGITC